MFGQNREWLRLYFTAVTERTFSVQLQYKLQGDNLPHSVHRQLLQVLDGVYRPCSLITAPAPRHFCRSAHSFRGFSSGAYDRVELWPRVFQNLRMRGCCVRSPPTWAWCPSFHPARSAASSHRQKGQTFLPAKWKQTDHLSNTTLVCKIKWQPTFSCHRFSCTRSHERVRARPRCLMITNCSGPGCMECASQEQKNLKNEDLIFLRSCNNRDMIWEFR